MPNLKLLTTDEVEILVDYEIIKCSILIRNTVERLGFNDEVFPLMATDYDTMQLILTWATQHKNDPRVPSDYEDTVLDINDIPEWDKNFLQLGQTELLHLLQAASFLHIPKLMEYCHKTVAQLLTGKTAAEMMKTFGIGEDDSEEEVDIEKQEINKEEITNNLNSLSDEEFLLKKRKSETLKESETEEWSYRRKKRAQEQ